MGNKINIEKCEHENLAFNNRGQKCMDCGKVWTYEEKEKVVKPMGTTEKEMKKWKEKLWEISSYDSQHDTVFYYGDIVDFVEKLLEQERQKTLEEVYGFIEKTKGMNSRKEILEHIFKLLKEK